MDLIYASTQTQSSVAAGSQIPMTVLSRRKGLSADLVNGAVAITKPGYYKVVGTATFQASAGTASIAIQKNGAGVIGATGALTAEASTTYELAADGIVRVFCGEPTAVLAIANTGTAMTVSNASISVIKVG